MADTVLENKPEAVSAAQSSQPKANGSRRLKQPVDLEAASEDDRTVVSLPRAVIPQDVPPEAALNHPALYFNRELGWIDFNWRVLYLALDERTPSGARSLCGYHRQ